MKYIDSRLRGKDVVFLINIVSKNRITITKIRIGAKFPINQLKLIDHFQLKANRSDFLGFCIPAFRRARRFLQMEFIELL